MMRLRLGFQNKVPTTQWYDLREDWVLIEASLAKQYGIRLRQEYTLPWTEFCILVAGLMPDTPLGSIVGIRAETDQEVIKGFSSDQSSIHNTWQKRQAILQLEDTEKLEQDMKDLSSMFASMFGKGGDEK